MNIAILVIVHPNSKKFLKNFIKSINNQSYIKFTLIIINETLNLEKFKELKKLNSYKIFNGYKNNGQKNRLFGLKKCLELNFDLVIVADSDDTMEKNRVLKIVNFFNTHKSKKIVFSNAINNKHNFQTYYKKKINLNDIIHKNSLGMGCMALKKNMIKFILDKKNNKIKFFDWWLATIILAYHKKVEVLKNSIVYYRIHKNNLLGPNSIKFLTSKSINDTYNYKINHFKELSLFFKKRNHLNYHKLFNNLYYDYIESRKIFKKSKKQYIKILKNRYKIKKLLWFEQALIIKKKYE